MERYYKRKIDIVASESSSITNSQVSEEPDPEVSVTSLLECLFEPPFKLPHQWENEYETLLGTIVDCAWFLMRQGIDFYGVDEFDDSRNQGNFLELLDLLSEYNEGLKAVLSRKSPETMKLLTLETQKNIINASATETTQAIVKEIWDGPFSIFFGESNDVAGEYHIAIILRYVDRKGFVIERFLGFKFVDNCTAPLYKKAVEDLLSSNGLSISRLCGQSYDVTSDKQVQLNAVKTLIMEENAQAYYVHYSSHQLQSALMSVSYSHLLLYRLIVDVDKLLSVIGARYKNQDALRDQRSSKVMEALKSDTIYHNSAADRLQGSYYDTFLSLTAMFSEVLDVLEDILDDGYYSEDRGKAYSLLDSLQTFDFVISLHLMKSILGVTNDLSSALQRNVLDIVNVVGLVQVSKQQLQIMKESGWYSFMEEVSSFCGNNFIDVPNMDEMHKFRGPSRLRPPEITNYQYYCVELFYKVIDTVVEDLNDRFNEVNMELLLCVASLNPSEFIVAFDKKRLVRFAEFYPKEFPNVELLALADELENFILDARSCAQFFNLKGIDELACVMVESGKDTIYPLVYKLLTLALILPVSPAKVERASSSMKTLKNWLSDQAGDQMMSDRLVAYIESEMFSTIQKEDVINRFHQ